MEKSAFNGSILKILLCLIWSTNAQMTTEQPATCMAGAPGTPGPPGRDGRDGRDGMTIIGPAGPQGQRGEPGCNCPGTNIRQCSWRDLGNSIDDGPISSCNMTKKAENTALRITWYGDMRVYPVEGKEYGCSRWFFTINGQECVTPNPIDAILLASTSDKNEHRPSTVSGICEGVRAGPVTVAFHVGYCPYGDLGDAHTGWQSVSRIILEEILIQN